MLLLSSMKNYFESRHTVALVNIRRKCLHDCIARRSNRSASATTFTVPSRKATFMAFGKRLMNGGKATYRKETANCVQMEIDATGIVTMTMKMFLFRSASLTYPKIICIHEMQNFELGLFTRRSAHTCSRNFLPLPRTRSFALLFPGTVGRAFHCIFDFPP